MKRIAVWILCLVLASAITGGSILLLVYLAREEIADRIEGDPEKPDQPQMQPPLRQSVAPLRQSVSLPSGTVINHEADGLMLMAPDGTAFAALFRERETQDVGFLIVSDVTGRVSSGAYRGISFPPRLLVLETEHSGHIELVVNLPTALMQDFVQTFIDFCLEAQGIRQTVHV